MMDLPPLPPADVSPYDSEDENGPSEYAWYQLSVQAYAREAVAAAMERCAVIARDYGSLMEEQAVTASRSGDTALWDNRCASAATADAICAAIRAAKGE